MPTAPISRAETVMPHHEALDADREPATQACQKLVSARWWIRGGLAVVVVTACIFRFDGITSAGIRYDDEGAYVGDARLWHRCALVSTDRRSIGAVMRGDKATLQKRMDDLGVDFGARYVKPSQGYTFLGALAMFAVGDRPAALLALNAVSGVLTVIMLYAIGATLFGRAVGLCGAMLLAVSPYHLSYCRSAFADATAGLFVLLGLWIFIVGVKRRWRPRRTYGLSGLFLGFAVTCHYRCLYVPAVLVIADMLTSHGVGTDLEGWVKRTRSAAHRWTWLAVGVAVPLICIEFMFQAAHAAAWLSDSFLPLDTYFEAWWKWIGVVLTTKEVPAHAGSLAHNSRAYFGYFVHWHGMAAAVLTIVGVVVVLRRKGIGRIPALVALLTMALLVSQPYTVARAMSTAIPSLCLCAAVALFRLPELCRLRGRSRAIVVGALLILLSVPAVKRSSEVYARRSNVADACAFVATQGGEGVAVPVDTYHKSKYWLYLEGADVSVVNGKFHRLGSPEAVVDRLRRDGVRWFITDPQDWHYRDTPPGARNRVFRWWEALGDYLDREADLAAEFPHIDGSCWEFLAEGPGIVHLDEMIRRHAGRLRIYDLDACGSITGGSRRTGAGLRETDRTKAQDRLAGAKPPRIPQVP